MEVVYWSDLNKEYYGNETFVIPTMSKAHYLINLQLYQTIDGRSNREQIWGSYFLIEMIKLSYLGLLIVGLLQWGMNMYVSQNIKELLYSRIHS